MRRAFTLIELLVVISIIALLIAILLPALSKARESAIRVQCLSQTRSLGQATYAYMVDKDGAIPQRKHQPLFLPQMMVGSGFDLNKDLFSEYMPITITGSGASADRQGDEVLFCPGDLYRERNPNTTVFNYKYLYITYQYFPTPENSPYWAFEKNGRRYQPDPVVPSAADLTQYPVWGDLCVKKSAGTYLGHDAENTVDPPTGMNTSYGDGSGFWTPWSECDAFFFFLPTGQDYYWSELNS